MNNHDSTHSTSKTFSRQILSSTGSSSPVLVPTPTSLESAASTDTALMDESGETAKTAMSVEERESSQPAPLTLKTEQEDAKASLAGTGTKAKTDTESGRKLNEQGKRSSSGKKKNKTKTKADISSSDSSSESESSADEREQRKKIKKKKARKAAQKKAAKAKSKERSKRAKRSKKDLSSDDSDLSDSDSESDVDSSSEEEKSKRKKRAKARAKLRKKASKKYDTSSGDSSSSSSDSSTDSESSEDEKAKRRRRKKKTRRSRAVEFSDETEDEDASDTAAAAAALTANGIRQHIANAAAAAAALQSHAELPGATTTAPTEKAALAKKSKKNALVFKRVDQMWDAKIRDYKYVESAEEQKDDFDSVFTVRRILSWENKYIETQVDIKSKLLRNALQVVFKDCKNISLVEDKPCVQPNTLYHYYNEIKAHVKKILQPQLRSTKKRKGRKQLKQQMDQCKLLLEYLDEDYKNTRKTLKPMLKAGTITYNLVWALFKPNTIIYTPTYGNKDDPRCFKVDYCWEEEDWSGKRKWNIEGRYLEYDGKVFGLGDHIVQIPAFKGHRRITNMAAYPLSFHKNPDALREQLIERGKKFVALQGMNYRFQKGLAYMKVKLAVQKFNINGRVMIDPALFRRINANYPLSYIKADDLSHEDEEEDSDSDGGCGCESESGSEADDQDEGDEDSKRKVRQPKGRIVVWKDRAGKRYLIRIPPPDVPDITTENLEVIAEGNGSEDSDHDSTKHVFSEEELLIASPVVLGFSFSEKAWVEFSLAGITDIQWNDEAFDTLVLPPQIKQNLKGLVSSHRFDAARTIDDVIVGKGKGLNVVLHGPPGVGKTLTGESIAEYLRCPLYAVSSGELGTSAAQLERDLNRIMNITHSWGAILLLDEADVFLEARQPHDIHRNALVSVFLRLTEYYQGILFLTTNRVATFDEAFQSRIHMGIRYENLTMKARKTIWMHYIAKVLAICNSSGDDAHKSKAFKEEDYNELSRKVMNGRQIKNAVKTSQAIAVSEKGTFSMSYVKRVMVAHETFEEDMRGGAAYTESMKHYQ